MSRGLFITLSLRRGALSLEFDLIFVLCDLSQSKLALSPRKNAEIARTVIRVFGINEANGDLKALLARRSVSLATKTPSITLDRSYRIEIAFDEGALSIL